VNLLRETNFAKNNHQYRTLNPEAVPQGHSRKGDAMTMTRRDPLGAVGMAAGTAAMYHAMATLGHAQESNYRGPIRLEGEPNGRRVLVLGVGLAGMTAALELRNAGYDVQMLEYRERQAGDAGPCAVAIPVPTSKGLPRR